MFIQSAIDHSSSTGVTISSADGWATPTAGSLLLACCITNQASPTDEWNTPAGWTEEKQVYGSGSNQLNVFSKVSDGTGSSLTFSGTSSKRRVVALVEVGNQVAVTPIKNKTDNRADSQTSHTTPAYDNASDAVGIYIYVVGVGPGGPGAWGAWGAGITTAEEDASTAGTNDVGLAIGYQEVSTSASRSGNKSWTNAIDVQGITLFVAEASAATGTIADVSPAAISEAVAQVDIHGTVADTSPAAISAAEATLGPDPSGLTSVLNQVF